MLKKKLTFMLIPNSMGILKQLSIPVVVIYIAVAAVLGLMFVNFFLSASFFSTKVDQSELERLRAENLRLKEKYEQLRWNLSEVEDRFKDLVEKEIRIRAIFDLEEIDKEERQLGIGGPTSPRVASLSEVEKTAVATEVEVDRLLRLSRFELEKYGEVEQSLQQMKTRLDHTPSIWPTKGWMSRGYGMKFDPFTGLKQLHRGVDIANRTGTPIIAAADGVVSQIATASGMGKYAVIQHDFGFETCYGHMSKITVTRGQKVKRGDIIGLMGSTGYSTGPHLHYEVLRNGKNLDPLGFMLNDRKE